ncbi:MAG: hypothetical protein F4X36_21940 [Gammaproteobacteria bacterium]|nr:hypothetical protein [Gammaproteobacteria bacterium]
MIAKRLMLAGALVALAGAAFADDYAESWGPPVGATAPAIAAADQDGMTRDLGSLCGERGVLFVLSRSADW